MRPPKHGAALSPSAAAAVKVLGERMQPTVATSIDVLHVAASLESSGITDDLAQVRYGHADVFALARTLRAPFSERDCGAPHPGIRPSPVLLGATDTTDADQPSIGGVSSVGHGVIYLLPALCMPALLDLVGVRYAALALVVGAAVGWSWAVLATWRAYAVMSRHDRSTAEDHLRRSVLIGVAAGVAAGTLLVLTGAPPVVGVVATAVTLAQLGTTLLFFLRRRALLALVLVGQGAVGMGNLIDPAVVPSAWVLVAFTLAAVGLLATGGAWHRHRRVAAPVLIVPGLGPVLWYTVASVTFLLVPQAALLRAGDGSPLALAGLFLTLGFVEWRGGALSDRLRSELGRLHSPVVYRHRRRILTVREGLACAAVTALAAVGVLLGLRDLGLLTPDGVVVAGSTVPLAAAYMVTLVLANSGAQTWLALSFAGGVAVETVLWLVLDTTPAVALVAATVVLLATLAIGLLGRPVNHFR